MLSFSTKPTRENALKMFKNDGVGRNQYIVRFVDLLCAIDDECSIALDGDWGSGKTFFAMQVKLILDAYNRQSGMDEESREEVFRIMESLKRNYDDLYYATVYYDAWANDNNEDPILSFIYEALKDITVTRPDNQRNIIDIAAAIAEVVTGAKISNLLEKIKGDDFFKTIKNEQHVRDLLKEFISNLIEERGNRLIIFIDELDRCKPEYAIRLLERLKHYFDDKRVVFVFSINLSELQHTIRAYYGVGFDATRYLDKFFDLRVSLPRIDYDMYIRRCFQEFATSHYADQTCVNVIKHFHFTLRETERFLRLCKIAYNKNANLQRRGALYELALSIFIPIAIGLSIRDIGAYRLFIKGANSELLREILPDTDQNRMWGKDLMLKVHEFFEESDKKRDGDIVVDYMKCLLEYYKAFFSVTPAPSDARRLEEHGLNIIRTTIQQVLTLLSPLCDYGKGIAKRENP